MRNADASSLIHESGHIWYHHLVEDVFAAGVKPQARVRLRRDLQTIVDWFGLDIDVANSSVEEILAATTVEHHEKFARAIEAYFREGKAPTEALRAVFARFAAWLKEIYRSARDLDVELNDDVRAVFDRLLAGEDAIQQQRARNLYQPPAALLAALTAAQRAQLEEADEEALTQARMTLDEQIAREAQRRNGAAWRDEEKRLAQELAPLVRQHPAYAALALLRGNDAPEATKEKR